MSDEQPDAGTADSADRIRFEVRNQVAWLTIDSPDRGNALTPAMRTVWAASSAGSTAASRPAPRSSRRWAIAISAPVPT